eukprot:PhM_4_TR14133/c4_g1_i2/m.39427
MDSDDDEEEDEEPGAQPVIHKFIRDNNLLNAMLFEESGVWKDEHGRFVVVECLAHAVHNAMKDVYAKPPLSEKWSKARSAARHFGQMFFGSPARRGRFQSFMEDWHKMGGVSVSPAEKLLKK